MTTKNSKRALAFAGAAMLVAAVLATGTYAGGGGDQRSSSTDALDPNLAQTLEPFAVDGVDVAQANPCNPCAGKNPCAGANPCNPCAGKNPCAGANPCNPCAGKNPCGGANPCNPCAGKNPCAMKNPCGGNPCGGAQVDPERVRQGSRTLSAQADLALGEKLWNDRFLGKSGLACSSCHVNNYMQMNPTFAKPYPHRVAMVHQQAGLPQVNAAEMVQFCMVVPMMSDTLDWGSQELASLAAWVESLQDGYAPVGGATANPCNPCATKNPCNPCSGRNPCGG